MKNRGSLVALLFALLAAGANSTRFIVTNRCSYTVWAGTLAGGGTAALPQTGFQLDPGASTSLAAPPNWSGRLWGRTRCSADGAGRFSCLTGDCASGQISCNGAGAIPPATLVEFTLNGSDNQDFYDTSLVDGYNLPFSVTPQGGSGPCAASGCAADINKICPPELAVKATDGSIIACKSACEAFNTDEYCCRGAFGTPDKCPPTRYSMIFKNACPTAYSYAYDDKTSTFTCKGADYHLTFCP